MSELSNRLPVLAAEVRAAHEGMLDAAKTAAERAVEAGHLLLEAKALVKHGEWLPWLKEHCGLSERTAQAYSRLARKHGEMDQVNAQRVAHLPIREAMKAIADYHVSNELPPKGADQDTCWAWADRQIKGPFNRFDLENPNCLRNKLLDRTDVPLIPAFLLGVDTSIPLLTLVSSADLEDALRCLAPIIKDKKCDFDVDIASMSNWEAQQLLASIGIAAEQVFGLLLSEYSRRSKNLDLSSPEAWRESLQLEQAKVLKEWMAGIDDARKRNDRLTESANFKGLAKVGTRIHRNRPVASGGGAG